MKPYVEKNTELRKEPTKNKDSFGKEFFKLMNNSVFGKTIENIKKRQNIKINLTKKFYNFMKLVNSLNHYCCFFIVIH